MAGALNIGEKRLTCSTALSLCRVDAGCAATETNDRSKKPLGLTSF
jgi:hypothetical protein